MDHDYHVTDRVIGCAIEVHRALGPGLLERAYLMALCAELAHAGIAFERERSFSLVYRDLDVGVYIPDLIVEAKAIVRGQERGLSGSDIHCAVGHVPSYHQN